MKKKRKLICIITSVMLSFNMFNYTVMASDSDEKDNIDDINGEIYISDFFSQNINEILNVDYMESYESWQAFLDEKSQTGDYIGTPYNDSLYAASPQCDPWQGYVGTNCTGFVWHIISNGIFNCLSQNNEDNEIDIDIGTISRWVPNVNGFNQMGFSINCWNEGGWWTFITNNKICYYEFKGDNAHQDMLDSDILNKGDIIWCVDSPSAEYEGLDGLLIGSYNNHIGIYMGDGTDDLWWHSGVKKGDLNCISPITCAAERCTYVVIPWGEDTVSNTIKNIENMAVLLESNTKNMLYVMTMNDMIQKADIDNDGNISVDVAEFIFRYYINNLSESENKDNKNLLMNFGEDIDRVIIYAIIKNKK